MTNDNGNAIPGVSSTVAVIVAAIGLLGVVRPDLVWLPGILAHKAELYVVLPPIVTALGGLWAWLSHPPAWLKEPIADAAYWIKSWFRRRPQA